MAHQLQATMSEEVRPNRFLTGQTIGKYTITGTLGTGEGAMYRAMHVDLRKERAVKILGRDADPEQLEQICHEACLLGRVDHPNIVRVCDFHSDEELTYLVLELLDGVTLEELIGQNGRLETLKALEIVYRLADGLQHLSSQGIIHRDIKPASIIVTKTGVPKLSDLGLGIVPRKVASELDTPTAFLTKVGAIQYIAPEQVETPHQIDLRADIYALGAVFYHMLTGVPPGHGIDVRELAPRKALAAATNEPLYVPPHERVSGLPMALSHVVMKMLASNPTYRYGSYATLLDDLNRYRMSAVLHAPTTNSTTTPTPPKGNRLTDSTMVHPALTKQATVVEKKNDNLATVIRLATVALTSGDRHEAKRLLLPWKPHGKMNEAYWLLLARTAGSAKEGIDIVEEGRRYLPNAERLYVAREQFAAKMALNTRKCPFCSTPYPESAHSCLECGGRASLNEPRIWHTHQPLKAALIRRAMATYVKAAEQQADFRWSLAIGLAHLNLREYPEALQHLREALRCRPDYVGLPEQIAVVEEWVQAIKPARGSIAVIDDSPTVRRMVETKLREFDYAVVGFPDGETAMEQLTDLRPDAILLDVNMPGRDGYQVCSWIRSQPGIKKTPIILLTGEDGFFDKLRGKMAGANKHMGKPFNADALVQMIDTLLLQRRA